MAIKVLHIVDGDSGGGTMRQAGFAKNGAVVSWRDALYTGPVPRGLTLRQLSRLRSRFWTGKSTSEFDQRDAALARHRDYDEIVLWFGSTSICQLSLAQLLAWFEEHAPGDSRLSLVTAYAGWLTPEQLIQAHAARRPVTPAERRLGRRVWRAFTAPSPTALARLLAEDLRDLPEMRDTISSILQEYPERSSGLSRLERKLLRVVDSFGITTPAFAVAITLHDELIGDTLLFDMLRTFVTTPHPLLQFAEPFDGELGTHQFNRAKIGMTGTGRRMLEGRMDHVATNGIDRWIGGVHLEGHRVRWRWDESVQKIISA